MIANRPAGWKEPTSGHVVLAGPPRRARGRTIRRIRDADDRVGQTVELHDRQPVLPAGDGGALLDQGLHVAVPRGHRGQLSVATRTLHDTGVVIGDFNERNILVSRRPGSRCSTATRCRSAIRRPTIGFSVRSAVRSSPRPSCSAPTGGRPSGCRRATCSRSPSTFTNCCSTAPIRSTASGKEPTTSRSAIFWQEGLWVHGGDSRLSPRPGSIHSIFSPRRSSRCSTGVRRRRRQSQSTPLCR